MIVISDTTPLISLLKIDQVDLLEKLFGKVIIPCRWWCYTESMHK